MHITAITHMSVCHVGDEVYVLSEEPVQGKFLIAMVNATKILLQAREVLGSILG